MMLAGALENFYDAYLIESTGKSSPSTRRTDLSRFTRFVRWTAAETIEEFVRVVSVRETWKDYILQATRELGSPSSVINDATSITTGVRALEAKGPAAARAIDFKTIALWRNELLRPVRREKNAYNSSMMDRDAQEAAGVMPAGGFTELRDALVPALARAVQAAQEIDAGQPATDARLNHIAAMAIARLYVEVPTSRPGPIANLSVKEANALIETGFARLYGTKNPGEHPTADQTASPVVQQALTAEAVPLRHVPRAPARTQDRCPDQHPAQAPACPSSHQPTSSARPGARACLAGGRRPPPSCPTFGGTHRVAHACM